MVRRVVTIIAIVAGLLSCKSGAPGTPPLGTPAPTQRVIRDTQPLSQFVLRVICGSSGSAGTAFVHSSGRVITAAHVVAGCKTEDLSLFIGNSKLGVAAVAADAWLDLALLTPKDRLKPGLPLSSGADVKVGDPVVTWGFPGGYLGLDPLVRVGYLAGVGPIPAQPKPVMRAFVNGAFNLGNSGGPVIDVASLTVVGVVNAKLAPVPADVQSAMTAIEKQSSGFMYTATTPDGKTINVSEAQVVSRIIQHLQSQTQLVIGTSVLLGDIRNFLVAQGVAP